MDKTVGALLTYSLSSPRLRAFPSPQKILIIRPGGIGDAVLLIPTIKTLRKKFPHAIIDMLAEERNSAVYSLITAVNKVYHYDRPIELSEAVRGYYDLVIDTEQWHRLSAVVARLNAAPVLIGYATNERRKLFTHPVPYSHESHEIDSFFNLISFISEKIFFVCDTPFLTVPELSKIFILQRLKPLAGKKIISFFPGGSLRERQWGSGRFRQTAEILCERGYGIVVVGGNDDMREGEKIIQGIPNSMNFCGKLSLPETAAVLEQSSLLITGDSGIMHIGYGLGIKIVALFGPGREKKWAPREGNCIVINKHLSCSPCTTFGYTPKCKRNAECMKQITVAEVFAAAMTLLNEN